MAGAPVESPPPFCLVRPGATLSVRIGTSLRHTTLSADVLSRLNELEVMAASDGMVFDL